MHTFFYCVNADHEERDKLSILATALKDFHWISHANGSFFGILLNEHEFIQFAWTEEDKWLADSPIDSDNMIFLQRYATTEECEKIIMQVYEEKSLSNLVDFVEVPIIEKTLDEVLDPNYKKPGFFDRFFKK